jgi:predicted nucleotidyltransferase
MIFKTEGIKGRLEQELSGVKGIKAAFIYGSFAKDEERSDSDIDLFLIGDIDEDELISKISSLEKEFIREINYTIYTQREFKKEKKNKNSFVLEVIGDPKIFLTGGSSDL